VKNKYACLKSWQPACLTLWCMQFVYCHGDPTQEVKPEVLCWRITGVRRTLLSLLVVIEMIVKLFWTCDAEVLRAPLSKNS